MIRALALATLLAACSFDATLGLRTAPTSSDAPQAYPDATAQPDLPPNFAFDLVDAGAPLLFDPSGYIYASQDLIANPATDHLFRYDPATGFRLYVTGPVTALAQDVTTIYALAPGSGAGLSDLLAISKSPTYPPTGGPIDAADPAFSITTLRHDVAGATALAVDSSAIYVVVPGGLTRLDKTGANPTTLFTTTGLSAVALDDNFAYVAEYEASGRLIAIPKAGGTALVLASALVLPRDVDVAAGYVYLTEQGDAAGGAIGRVAAPTFGATQADVGTFSRIVVDAHTPVALTHDDTYVYWTADRDGLMRAPLAGGSAELRMGTPAAGNTAVAIEADQVMFSSPSDQGGREVRGVVR